MRNFKLLLRLQVGRWNTALLAVIIIQLFNMIYKEEIPHRLPYTHGTKKQPISESVN